MHDFTQNAYPTFEAACAAQDAPEPIETHVVQVTVKIDAKRSDATLEALQVIEAALVSFYGGDEGGWHAWHTVTRPGGRREILQSISLEGARL